MPNGELPEPPKIHDDEPNAPALRYLMTSQQLLYNGMGELKEELANLSVWRKDVDGRHIAGDARSRGREDVIRFAAMVAVSASGGAGLLELAQRFLG